MNVPDTDIQLSKKYQTDDNFIFQMIFFSMNILSVLDFLMIFTLNLDVSISHCRICCFVKR